MKKRNYFSDIEDRRENAFSVIADFEGSEEQLMDIEVDEILPVLPLRNMVLFPGVFMPVSVGRKASLKLIREAEKKNLYIAVVCQKIAETESPLFEDLHSVGTIAKIVRVLEMPDQTTTVILQGSKRMELKDITDTIPYLKGHISTLNEEIPAKDDKEFQALVEACKDLSVRYIKSSDMFPQDSSFAIKNITNPMFLVDFICTNLPLKKDEKIELLRIDSLRARTYRLLEILNREVQLAEIKESIQMRAREDIDQQQREYFLQQQIKTIQDELGGGGQEQEIEEMRKKAETIKWSEGVKALFLKEVDKLERTHPQSPDYSVQLNYLQTMLSLPWGIYTMDNLNLVNAEKTLNKDHYGLEKVKERILEHLAVLKLKGDMKSPIICLYGPPGVGKTSLGRSIAAALKRKYIRMSLGGVHDEAEIRGHRKTYIGAMPGRIMEGIKRSGVSNPVIVLDEVDKLAKDYGGDPASALLEVLDPEQNSTFTDHYMNVPYDLSNVLFVCTANSLDTIPEPLLNRMEVINFSGYTAVEKYQIARRHLLPKALDAMGIKKNALKVTDGAIRRIIDEYTMESGVRDLKKLINTLCRTAAVQLVKNEGTTLTVTKTNLEKYLGKKQLHHERKLSSPEPGVVTGLAWTRAGGEILFIESKLIPGKGKMIITGQLGDVMKESIQIALSLLKSLYPKESKVLDDHDLHIHVPAGAVPKDGPSAGITLTTALASLLTGKKVSPEYAMTGEVSLRGGVMPIGGLPEKLMAAQRAGITKVLIPADNEQDLDDVADEVKNKLEIIPVKKVTEVLKLVLK